MMQTDREKLDRLANAALNAGLVMGKCVQCQSVLLVPSHEQIKLCMYCLGRVTKPVKDAIAERKRCKKLEANK